MDDGDEVDVDVCSGRLYYHTSTCLPVKPNEGDIDSEADMDPDWLKERTQLMIDEFTDVNEGEKELLKLWNLHIMSNYKYKNDSMIRLACLDFVEREGNTILSKNLTRNLVLHLANLWEYGLLSSGDVLEFHRKFKRIKAPPQSSPTRVAGKVKLERNSNEHCQLSPPAKRALLNSHCNQ
jgi:polycomb protein SUZ12